MDRQLQLRRGWPPGGRHRSEWWGDDYTYDGGHRTLRLLDACGVTFPANEYNTVGRATRQTHAEGPTYEFACTLDGSAKVTQADVTDRPAPLRE